MKKRSFILFILSLAAGFSQSQEIFHLPVNYLFSSDSLAGFNEHEVKQAAFNEGYFGSEFKVYMYRSKRNFVDSKYSIRHIMGREFKYVDPKVAAVCVNEDFESSPTGSISTQNQISGWNVTSGTNSTIGGSCNLNSSCCPGAPNQAQVLSNGYTDPDLGPSYPIYSVFGSNLNAGSTVTLNTTVGQMYGNNFISINDNIPSFGVHKLSKTLLVTPSNALFRFAFINLFWTAHPCCDAACFKINFTNLTTGTSSLCPTFSFAPGPTCVYNSPITYYTPGNTGGNLVYNPWEVRGIDLTPFMGNSIQVDFIISDCTAGAHQAKAYIDAQCGPMQVLTNVPSGNPEVCLSAGSVTLNAIPGFSPYLWKGPGTFTSVAQSISVSTPGMYTLTLGEPCLKTTYVVTVTPTPTLVVTPFNFLCNGSTSISANGAASYTWMPGNLTGSLITPSPTITTNYTVVGANGTCTNSAISTVSVGVAPPLLLTSDKQSGCKGSCITFSSSSTSFNSLQYNWGDSTIFVPMQSSHCYSVPGIYSISAKATYSSGCSVINSGVLTVTILPAPNASITVVGGNAQPVNGPITFNNNSSGANQYSWTFNDSSAVFNTLLLNQVVHTYTSSGNYCVKLVATDTVLGCKDTTTNCLDILCTSKIRFPNVFTPNGDDVNEVFSFDNTCIKSLNCIIYDRWGLELYQWDTVHGGWDGHTTAGVLVSDGTYFFILKYVDSNGNEIRKTGFLNLFR